MCISILKSYVSLKKEMMKKCCLFLAILLLATFISWLHIRAGEHNNATAWEIERWNKNTPDFNLNSFLIFFPSLLFGMPFIFSKDTYRDWKKIFILFWALTPLLLLPFASILSLPKIRLLEGIPFVPFGILFVYSRDALGKTKHQWIKYLFTVVLFVTMIPTTFSILFANSNHHLQKPLDPYVQFSPSFWQTVRFVNDNVPKNSVILSDQYTGLILPAFAPVRSYFGHYNLTYNFETKQKNTRRFFANEMDDIQVHTFIKENNIRYIIWGPDEKKFGPKELRYTLLNPIYSAGEYTVYKTLPE
jgi:hypothetical protein